MKNLDSEIAKLTATVARQAGREELHRHLELTRRDLVRATAERDQVADMLTAIGHPYPCSDCSADR